VPKPGDVIAEKYVIERSLGAGGMGAVFQVAHRVTGRRFAVKWLLPGLAMDSKIVSRFVREARATCSVNHPNVVEVYDFGQEGGSLYMVMELLQGETLSARLSREGKLDPAEACRILTQVARGVSAAHAVGVIHRDLKPDNIFLAKIHGGKEIPKVLDFGVAKLTQAAEVHKLTATGAVIGTPRYMAPEQVSAKPVDARADVYALGVTLYQMLSGQVPFRSETYARLVLEILTGTPVPLRQAAPELPRRLVDMVDTAIAHDPDARFASVDEFAEALAAFAGVAIAGRAALAAPAAIPMPGPAAAPAPVSVWDFESRLSLADDRADEREHSAVRARDRSWSEPVRFAAIGAAQTSPGIRAVVWSALIALLLGAAYAAYVYYTLS